MNYEKATFGGGCFWGVELTFSKVEGVVETAAGYEGGTLANPTYEDVCADETGHTEVVQVVYDPEKVSYQKLLEVFWGCHNPTELNRQGPDVGTQYRSVIFYHSNQQKEIAEKSKQEIIASGRFSGDVVTVIAPASKFYKAEEYHQQYLKKKGADSCGL